MRERRVAAVIGLLVAVVGWLAVNPNSYETEFVASDAASETDGVAEYAEPLGESAEEGPLATAVLELIAVKGRAPKTGYDRSEQFYSSWPTVEGCNLRQRILKRDFGETAVMSETDGCVVVAGSFVEPYTGQLMTFTERAEISKGVQIDHVVALSDAWQKGAQNLAQADRYALATDPLNLIAVQSKANQEKSDGDAATWLPANKRFRCQYVARQISVKYKYTLWVTSAEKEAMLTVLANCPNERAVGVEI